MDMSELTVETLTSADAFDSLAPAWRELEARAHLTLPFQTFAWNHAWWRHFAARHAWVRDELRLITVRDASGQLVAVAPMMLTRRPGVGPLSVRHLGFFGADPNITEVRGPLIDPAHEAEVTTAIGEHMAGLSRRHDRITWCGVRPGSPADERLTAVGARVTREIPCFLLPLPATWEELRSSRPRNLKESLRKCYNSLKRDNHVFTVDVARSVDEVRAAMPRFLELHQSRSLRDDTIRHRDVFAAPSSQAFLAEVVERFAAQDQARVFQLRIDGKVVAARIGFVLADTLYLYYSGYDPEWAPYSVMTTTVAEAIKLAIDWKLRWVNLSTGSDVSKTRWAPQEVVYREATLVSSTLRGKLAAAAHEAVTGNERWRGVARRLLGRRAA